MPTMSTEDPRTTLPPQAPSALAELLEQSRPQLLAYIDRRLGEALRKKVEPLDVYQETAVAALQAWPNADLGDREPFGWLCQIAEQRIVDLSRRFAARKRAVDREVPLNARAAGASREFLDLLAASLTSASSAVGRDERAARLNDAIAQLPKESQDVLHWRYVQGLPTKEIAAKIGKSDGAVRVLLTRTLHKLQTILGPEV
jgi:RNA polymerase sigma-70 factor (ECF subfamily)